jgi:imidazolonepropionase-like amidohydrolase
MIYASSWLVASRLLSLFLLTFPVHSESVLPESFRPPPEAARFSFVSIAGSHGTSERWIGSDGSRISHDNVNLRGNIFQINQSILYGGDGMPVRFAVYGASPQGDSEELFEINNGLASWISPVDSGATVYSTPAFYYPQGGTYDSYAALLEALLLAPNYALPLIPSGRATAERLTEVTIGEGIFKKGVVAWAVSGLTSAPMPMWATHDGKFFAIIGELSFLPNGYENSRKYLSEIQARELARRSKALATSSPSSHKGPVAFINVQLYDAEQELFLPDQTVVFEGSVITAVGPAENVHISPGTNCINGRGHTLIPGLWDSHMHFSNDSDGPLLLSIGVTSIRDPGNDNQLTFDRITRIARGELLGPTIYPSMMLDGQSAYTAQFATIISSASEALKYVQMAKNQGFSAIKIYGSFNPSWVNSTVQEAHRLGLHVHGHVPAGMRPLEAIQLGFDEITHINFVLMQAMPDEIITKSNGIERITGIARLASSVDIMSPPITNLVEEMARRRVSVDPTLSAFETMFVPVLGEIAPAYLPYSNMLPAITKRQLRMGSLASSEDLPRSSYRSSFLKMISLVKTLHLSKVQIVAGTDRTGLELVRELELYMEAGMSASQALKTATLEPAKLLGVARKTGSIRVGKIADLVLIQGDPSIDIGDLRNTRLVVREGKIWEADFLIRAAGLQAPRASYASYSTICPPLTAIEKQSSQSFIDNSGGRSE